jgi:RNA polymerase sigma factor (sigma-70 family)
MSINPAPAAPDPTPITDIIRAAAAGDQQAWAEIVRRYTPVVRTRMRPYRLQEADRLDVMQTVWMRLVENLDRLHTPAHLGGWLATVVARECQLAGRNAGRTRATSDHMELTAADPGAGPEQLAVDGAIARRLWGAVAELPASRRALIRALFCDDAHSYAEIARDTGVPIGGIGPTRGRAVRQLRALLADGAVEL